MSRLTAEAFHLPDFGCGVALDNAATLTRFQADHKLPYVSISDPDKKLASHFGAVGPFNSMKRLTVVADAAGKVVLAYMNLLNPSARSAQVLDFLKVP